MTQPDHYKKVKINIHRHLKWHKFEKMTGDLKRHARVMRALRLQRHNCLAQI